MKEIITGWVLFVNENMLYLVLASFVLSLALMYTLCRNKTVSPFGAITMFSPVWLLVWFYFVSLPVSLPIIISICGLYIYFRWLT